MPVGEHACDPYALPAPSRSIRITVASAPAAAAATRNGSQAYMYMYICQPRRRHVCAVSGRSVAHLWPCCGWQHRTKAVPALAAAEQGARDVCTVRGLSVALPARASSVAMMWFYATCKLSGHDVVLTPHASSVAMMWFYATCKLSGAVCALTHADTC